MRTEKQLANLKPPFKKGEYSERQRKGTQATKQNAKNLKDIRQWAQNNLFSTRGVDKTPLYEMLFKKLEVLCSKGNLKAIEMLLNYSGLKPIDKVEQVNLQPQKIFITTEERNKADYVIDEFIK